MKPRAKRAAAALLLFAALSALLSGCWDNREIIDYHLLTGTALDVSDTPGKLHILLQVAKINHGGSTEENKAGGSEEVLLLETDADSLMSAITELNRNSDRNLIFQHNQIRLFGSELAEQGIKKHLDMLMRDTQARLEVPMAVVDGRADDALSCKISQNPLSGVFLNGIFKDQAGISDNYQVRLIDFVHRMIDEPTAPVMPIIKITGEGEEKELKVTGMAVFKGDKMVGRLTNDEAMGYVFALGGVKKTNVEAGDGENRALLHIGSLNCKKTVDYGPEGVSVTFSVTATLTLGELHGYKKTPMPELMFILEREAAAEIEEKITSCFDATREMGADIFGIGTALIHRDLKLWKEIKDRWEELYKGARVSVRVNARLKSTGQIVQSLEMEEFHSEY